jgi:rhamnosyltransferase
VKHVFIIGSKGIPARYGGFETFVENLTARRQSPEIQYHVACLSGKANADKEFAHNGARCCNVYAPGVLGHAKSVLCDIRALRKVMRYIHEHKIEDAIVYVLACRMGLALVRYHKKLRELGATLWLNPDGHEWKRGKWNAAIQAYWKMSEKASVKSADLVICDSKAIQDYIQQEYDAFKPKTTFIAYGAELPTEKFDPDNSTYQTFLEKHGLKPDGYFLMVARYVPENNFRTAISEFLASRTDKKLLLICDKPKRHAEDPRIVWAGTVYDAELLRCVRAFASANIHGHEVGGTNPSLLEALALTPVNLLLDVPFNREVAEGAALYWNKDTGSLRALMERVCTMGRDEREALGEKSRRRIAEEYSWQKIVGEYEKLMVGVGK